MQSKQKVIEDAFGQHWDAVKDFTDPEGWVEMRRVPVDPNPPKRDPHDPLDSNRRPAMRWEGANFYDLGFRFEDIESRRMPLGDDCVIIWWRPKSLHMIDDNNGFKCIYSVDDMPFVFGFYEVWSVGGAHPKPALCSGVRDEDFKAWQGDGITHWREFRPGPVYWGGGEK